MKKTIVLKPTLDCNLRCKYCYEFRRDNLSEITGKKLNIDETKRIILKFATIFPGSHVLWMLHGGEPLLCGAEFLTELLTFLREVNKNFNVNFKFAIQTNATLLTDKILEILEENSDIMSERVISISIDGPKEINDSVRLTKLNKPSYEIILSSINKIKKSSLSFTTISVIGQHNINKPKEMYDFIKSINPNYAKFIPCYNFDKNGKVEEFGIRPMEYAKFIVKLFNLYSKDMSGFQKNKLAIDPIITIVSNLVDKRVSWCEYNTAKCDNFTTIFPNGDLWLCDTFDQQTMKNEAFLGNIFKLNNTEIKNTFENPSKYCSYSKLEKDILKSCADCEIKKYCYGGCVAVRENFRKKSNLLFKEHCDAKKFLIKHIRKPILNALS